MRKLAGILLIIMAAAGAIIGLVNVYLANQDNEAKKNAQLAKAREAKAERAAIRQAEEITDEEIKELVNDNEENIDDKNQKDQ